MKRDGRNEAHEKIGNRRGPASDHGADSAEPDMSPGGHLVTATLAGAAAYVGTGSAGLAAGLVAGGFLIDLDHVFDYVVFERQRDLRPSAFLRYYLEGRCRRVVLPLHSYELLVLLLLAAWSSHRDWLWGYTLGMMLHLPLDIIFNGRMVPGGLVRFYSFACRARVGFLAERFADASRLAPLEGSFWVSFFKGSRLKTEFETKAAREERGSEGGGHPADGNEVIPLVS